MRIAPKTFVSGSEEEIDAWPGDLMLYSAADDEPEYEFVHNWSAMAPDWTTIDTGEPYCKTCRGYRHGGRVT